MVVPQRRRKPQPSPLPERPDSLNPFTPSSMFISPVIPLQLINAHAYTYSTFPGIFRFPVNDEHPENAEPYIFFIDVGITIVPVNL